MTPEFELNSDFIYFPIFHLNLFLRRACSSLWGIAKSYLSNFFPLLFPFSFFLDTDFFFKNLLSVILPLPNSYKYFWQKISI